jgi:hypothetical protein
MAWPSSSQIGFKKKDLREDLEETSLSGKITRRNGQSLLA